MMIDTAAIDGRIAAGRPSFELLAELTGKPATASTMGFYVKHFAEAHVAMDDVNTAVEEILRAWQQPYWPSPEKIIARAQEIARRIGSTDRWISEQEYIEALYTRADDRKWENRVEMANVWRLGEPVRFKRVVRLVDQTIERFSNMFNLRPELHARLVRNTDYRKAFRDGAVVGGCLEQAGIDERARERVLAKERKAHAKQYAATGEMSEVAA